MNGGKGHGLSHTLYLSPAKEINNHIKYQNNEEIPIIFILHARSFFSIRLLF